jgi:hypothetical protein
VLAPPPQPLSPSHQPQQGVPSLPSGRTCNCTALGWTPRPDLQAGTPNEYMSGSQLGVGGAPIAPFESQIVGFPSQVNSPRQPSSIHMSSRPS